MVVKHKTCRWSLEAVKIVKVYICDICHKHIEKYSKLNLTSSVLQRSAGCNWGYFKCSGCKKSFGQKASLLVHKRGHSESKPYICVKCNRRFVTRAGLIMHKETHELRPIKIEELDYDEVAVSEIESGKHHELEVQLSALSKETSTFKAESISMSTIYIPKNPLFSEQCNPPINAQLIRLENGTLSLSLQQDNQNQSTQSQIGVGSKSQNVGHLVTLNVHDKSKLVLLSTENVLMQSSTSGQFSDEPNDLNKHKRAVANNILLCDVKADIDTSDYKFPDDQFQKSNEDVAQIECHVPASDACTRVANNSNCLITEKHSDKSILSVDPIQVSANLDNKLKVNQINTNSNEDPGKRLCTRKKIQKKILSPKGPFNRMVTRSLSKRKGVLTNKEHCTNMSKRPSSRKINQPKAKIMVIGSVEKDAYNVEADADIQNILKKDGVKNVLYFQCSMCPTKHLSERDLENHEKLHFAKKKKLFQSDICKMMYINEANLREHRRGHFSLTGHHNRFHAREKLFRCSTCSKEFPSRNTLRQHKKSHTKSETNFKCKNCDKAYLTAKTLVRHTEKSKKCNLCSQLFCTVAELSIHKNMNHTDALSVNNSDSRYCQYCNKTFKKDETFYIHLKKHSREGMPIKFPCIPCKESFDSFDLLLAHKKIHRVKRVKYISCPWNHCKKMFTCQARLDLHAKTHNGERHYLCYRCGKHFTDCVFYSKHRGLCRNKYLKITCKLCGKALSGYTSLKQHSRVHSGEKPQQCETCGARFKEVQHLRRHRLIHVRKGDVSLLKKSSTPDSVTAAESSANTHLFQPQDKALGETYEDFTEQTAIMVTEEQINATDIELLLATAEIELVTSETV